MRRGGEERGGFLLFTTCARQRLSFSPPASSTKERDRERGYSPPLLSLSLSLPCPLPPCCAQEEMTFLPFARLREMTRRPCVVLILDRKPCLRFFLMTLGW